MAMETICRGQGNGKHDLNPEEYEKPYTCDGCKEQGFGLRYRCKKCGFDFHEACLFDPIVPITHKFFPNSEFRFLLTPPKPCHPECKLSRCVACRNDMNGFLLFCKKDMLNLHPCCRNLETSYQIEDVTFNLCKELKEKCMWCNKKSLQDGGKNNGWAYMSECGEYCVHVTCVTQMALEKWNNKNNNSNTAGTSLAAMLNSREVDQRRKNGGRSGKNDKYWRILEVIIKTILSVVIGDPSTIIASLFVEAMKSIP